MNTKTKMNNDLRIKQISELVEQLAAGKYETRLTPSGIDDDLDVVIKNLNVMAGNLQTQQSMLSRVEQNICKLTDVINLLTPFDFNKQSPDASATDIWNATLATVNALTERLQQGMMRNIDTKNGWFEEHIVSLLKSVEQIPCIVMITNVHGDIEYVNHGFTKITGYSPEEVMGQNPRVLNLGKQSQEFYKRLWDTITSGSEWRGELVNRKKNGEFYWESAQFLPIKNHEGIVSYFMKVSEDITKYKQLDEELKTSKQSFNAIVNRSTDGVLVVDTNGIVKFANHSAEFLLGSQKGELIDNLLGIPTGSDSVTELNVFLESGKKGIAEMRVVDTVWKSEKAFLLLLRDITEHIRAEDAIRMSKDKLESKNKELERANTDLKKAQIVIIQQEKMASIGQLAAGVAHEINNPIGFMSSNVVSLGKYTDKLTSFINDVSSAIELLKEKEKEIYKTLMAKRKTLKLDFVLNDIKSLIKETLDGANRISNIVNSLKIFARSDNENQKTEDINKCIEDTLAIIRNELKYKAIIKKEYGKLPMTKCYSQQLSQVFMNILINAAQAIDTQGEISIKTCHKEDSIFVSISDTGNGIPEEVILKIMDPFFTTKDVGKGTGLGLSVSYDIIQKHHGDINVQSEVGKGTTFTVRIPVIKAEETID